MIKINKFIEHSLHIENGNKHSYIAANRPKATAYRVAQK